MTESVEARAVLNDPENITKFRELQEYMKEDIPQHITDKTGQAATVRLAIRMAHDMVKQNREDKQELHNKKQNLDSRMNNQADKL